MYPIMLEPIYKKMVWGGQKLSDKLGRSLPDSNIGESWDLSCRDNDMSIVENGALKGKKFIDVINMDRKGYLGSKLESQDAFPLLVKVIDAKDNLSIQVHPNDEYARSNEKDFYGKTEMWYILDADQDSQLVIGLKDGVTRDMLKASLECGDPMPHFNKLSIKKGDIIYIPSGLIHAITSGVMLAEIQQNSDITYRVYDYNRMGLDGNPRELHVDKALDVADFDNRLRKNATVGLSVEKDGNTITYVIANKYFAIEKYVIKNTSSYQTDGEKFLIFTCVDGEAEFVTENEAENEKINLVCGRSVFIPATLGKFSIKGNCILLKSYVPDIENDFVKPLLEAGYSYEQIENNCSKED